MQDPRVSVLSQEPLVPVARLQSAMLGARVDLQMSRFPPPRPRGLLSGEGHPLSLACFMLLSSTLFQNRSSVATLSFAWPQDKFSTVTAL